jgi:hypothetical protein
MRAKNTSAHEVALGEDQEECLRTLIEHGWWNSRCGWVWGGDLQTRRMLDRLVELGFVERKMKGLKTRYFPSALVVYRFSLRLVKDAAGLHKLASKIDEGAKYRMERALRQLNETLKLIRRED